MTTKVNSPQCFFFYFTAIASAQTDTVMVSALNCTREADVPFKKVERFVPISADVTSHGRWKIAAKNLLERCR